jgi:hypothetical protein
VPVSIFVAIIVLISADTAFSYGYGDRGEDPLIIMFKKVVREAKRSEKDWKAIVEIINEVNTPIGTLDREFETNLRAKFDQAIKDQDLPGLIKYSANLVFLSMMQKYDLILRDDFRDITLSKGRISMGKAFYDAIFKGNVMKYDKKNGTKLNETITKNMQSIQRTIGAPAVFGLGGDSPQPERFKKMYNEIKSSLLTAFPYFEG